MREVRRLGIPVLLAIVLLSVFVYADCPHCYSLIEVEIILLDGTSKLGYIGYYGMYSDKIPLVKGNDIKLNTIQSEYKVSSIQFYENVHFFEDIIFGARQEDKEEIDPGDIKKVIFISKTKYGGAGPVPILSSKDISLLSGEIYDVRKYSSGCYDVIYVNCNPVISSKEFDFFFEFSKRYGEPGTMMGSHPEYRFKYLERSEGDVAFIRDETESIRSEILHLSELIDSLKAVNQKSILTKHIKEFRAKYESVLKLSEAMLHFLSSDDSERYAIFEQNIASIFTMVPETDGIEYEINHELGKWDNIKPLFDIVVASYDGMYRSFSLKMFDDCDIVYAVWPWD